MKSAETWKLLQNKTTDYKNDSITLLTNYLPTPVPKHKLYEKDDHNKTYINDNLTKEKVLKTAAWNIWLSYHKLTTIRKRQKPNDKFLQNDTDEWWLNENNSTIIPWVDMNCSQPL